MVLRALLVAFAVVTAPLAQSQDALCAGGSFALPESSTFVGYTKPGENILRSVAIVSEQGLIEPYDGRHLAEGDMLQAVLPGTDAATRVAIVTAYLNRLGRDHCVFLGTIAAPEADGWQLWASRGLDDALRVPAEGEQQRLNGYQADCVLQGDLPEAERPPCVRARLLAVSDFDRDGNLEFWHTVPYTWDTGLSVMEESPRGPELLVEACPGCSD